MWRPAWNRKGEWSEASKEPLEEQTRSASGVRSSPFSLQARCVMEGGDSLPYRALRSSICRMKRRKVVLQTQLGICSGFLFQMCKIARLWNKIRLESLLLSLAVFLEQII